MDITTLAIAKKFTKDTAAQFGALKGASCTISSIVEIEGGHRVTFEWKNNAGATQTSVMDVMDGAGQKGDPGEKGDKGDPGETGAAGFSPAVTVTAITGGHMVTITDESGDHAFNVMDGESGQAESVDWSKITNKPDNLATTDDIDKKVFVAEYNVTTAQQINAFLDRADPKSVILVKRGNDYYTVITTAKQAENKVIIRTFATLSGNYYIFQYTITNAVWANGNFGIQQLLQSGTNIKTINGESLLGGGNISTDEDTGWQTLTGDYFDVSYRKKNGVVYVTWHKTDGVKQAFEAKVPVTNCTLPEGFRPTRTAYTMLVAPSAWNHGYAGVQTGGAMRVCFQNAIAQGAETMFGSLSYLI